MMRSYDVTETLISVLEKSSSNFLPEAISHFTEGSIYTVVLSQLIPSLAQKKIRFFDPYLRQHA